MTAYRYRASLIHKTQDGKPVVFMLTKIDGVWAHRSAWGFGPHCTHLHRLYEAARDCAQVARP